MLLYMGVEYEYQFTEYDKKNIIKLIKEKGGKKIHNRSLYSTVYFYSKDSQQFIRVRDENGSIVMTKKIIRNKENLHPLEFEIKLSSDETFNNAVEFAKTVMPKSKIIKTEKYREKWSVGFGCHEIVFDEWPGLPEYMEIDCTSQKSLDDIIKYLGLTNSHYFRRGAFDYYEKIYEIERKYLPKSDLTFNGIYRSIGKYAKKNKNILKKLQQRYDNNKN